MQICKQIMQFKIIYLKFSENIMIDLILNNNNKYKVKIV